MSAVNLIGFGMWTPGFASPAAWLEGRRDPAITVPPANTLVASRALRYTSILTRSAVAAFEQAIAGVSIDRSKVHVVFGSSLGEIEIAVELLDQIAKDGMPSPARFMNSVHNTAPAHLSIGLQSHGMFTAIAAGPQTVAATFVEGFGLAKTAGEDVVCVIVADESPPPPLNASTYPSLAVAFLLSAGSSAGLATIRRVYVDTEVKAQTMSAEIAKNPCAPALNVLRALGNGERGPIRLDGAEGRGYCLELSRES
jgi:hypothetical protein